MPAVVAAGNLMHIRGVRFDPIVRLQSWPIGEQAFGPWWTHQGPLSKAARIEAAMKEEFGVCYSQMLDRSRTSEVMLISAIDGNPDECPPSLIAPSLDGRLERFGMRPTKEEFEERHRTIGQITMAIPSTGKTMTVQEYAERNERMRTDLHQVCAWGKDGISEASATVLAAPSERRRSKPKEMPPELRDELRRLLGTPSPHVGVPFDSLVG